MNVVSEPRVISNCFPRSQRSRSGLVGFGIGRSDTHIGGFLGRLRCRNSCTPPYASDCANARRVIRAVADHGDQLAAGLHLGGMSFEAWPPASPARDNTSTPASVAIAAAVSGLSPAIMMVLMPMRRRSARRSLILGLDDVLQMDHAENFRPVSNHQRRAALRAPHPRPCGCTWDQAVPRSIALKMLLGWRRRRL